MIQDILQFAAEMAAEGQKVTLITVTKTTGSSPASPGQVMAVLADGTAKGTVGGGTTEHQLIQRAVEAIKNNEQVFEFSFDHAENGMVCGGGMSGFGNVLGSGASLVLFGGGHVAQSLAALAVAVGFSVTVVEDRPELKTSFSNVRYLICQPEEYSEKISLLPTSYVVICTRGHKTDDDALRFCLGKQLRYLGMIGSKHKADTLFSRLRQEGISNDDLKRIYCPIGLGIANRSPAEIAISILAEILLIKNNGTLCHKALWRASQLP